MVVPDSGIISHGEVDSPLQSDQQHLRSNGFSSLGRQSSIYFLTLDEFQHTLCEGGKNFGSMNMDEFLNSIWTAEENQALAQAHAHHANATTVGSTMPGVVPANSSQDPQFSTGMSSKGVDYKNSIAKQLSLSRQGSLTLPGPLSRKTVDEVWSEIHKTQNRQEENRNSQNPGSPERHPTFGEMTLEDFLVKAGVVREQSQQTHLGAQPVQHQQPSFGPYQDSNNSRVAGLVSHIGRPVMGMGPTSGGTGGPPYPLAGEPSGYAAVGKRADDYQQPTTCYGGGVANNGGGYGLGIASPVSPVSSNGITASQLEGRPGQYGLELGGIRGCRKRIIDGPVEKVVERRQRRMIKNRESAARSRARKQAYTVELEAELNMLKEENAHLRQALAEVERRRKQQYSEETKMVALTKAQKAKEKPRAMKRNLSSPY